MNETKVNCAMAPTMSSETPLQDLVVRIIFLEL